MEKKLNADQQAGFDLLKAFFESNERDKMVSIKGYAGTGKTFLISKFVEYLNEVSLKRDVFQRINIAMTAPTNKAVQVLRETFTAGTGDVTFKTIHSLLGLKEKIMDSGEISFERDFDADAQTSIKDFTILFIDEVSMLNDKLFFEIKRYNNEVKIIMVGDPAQIPPVGKRDCEPFLNPAAHGIAEFQLTKIMRQADGSAIIANSFIIRDNLEQSNFQFKHGKDLHIMRVTQRPAYDKSILKQKFHALFQTTETCDDVKVIAWTNRKVDQYNNFIRGILFGKGAPKLMAGERMVMNKPHAANGNEQQKKKRKQGGVEMLTTNMEITVDSFVKESVELYPAKRYDCYITKIKYINSSGKLVDGCIKIIHEDALRIFAADLEKIKQHAITGPTENRRPMWKEYYKLLRSVADVSYAYAITAHKSQGSTYKQTFVDAGNIQLNSNIVERNRILYTAITRAKSEVTLIL